MNDKIVEKAGDTMTENKLYGENQNIEFKREIPNNHEKFLKDVIAFSNSSGGKIMLVLQMMELFMVLVAEVHLNYLILFQI